MTAPDHRPADEVALTAAKSLLRRAVRARRAVRPEAERVAQDEQRARLVITELKARRPAAVAAYLSAGDEPDTLRVIAWLAAHDIPVLLPASAGQGWREPAWARYAGPDALREGPLSIVEPAGTALPADALGQAEVVLCPGLAATVRGERLGRGGGWYDRALAHATLGATTLVLLNDEEVLEVLPVEPHDRPVDLILTPTRRLPCSGAQRTSKPARD